MSDRIPVTAKRGVLPMLPPPEKFRTELEMLETALLNCSDGRIREVIKNWIVEAKQRKKQETQAQDRLNSPVTATGKK
jgi:hypothetical protein